MRLAAFPFWPAIAVLLLLALAADSVLARLGWPEPARQTLGVVLAVALGYWMRTDREE